jgi:MYND finger/Sel1 repeat
MTDTEDDEGELSRIEGEIARLQSEIEESSQLGHGLLRSHHKLQHELGLVWHRQAELEESIRIKEVRHQAVESGFVATAYFALGECAFCRNDMSDPNNYRSYELSKIYTCCGTRFCSACNDQRGDMGVAAGVALGRAMDAGNASELQALLRECAVLVRCPFCDAPTTPIDNKESYRLAMLHAEAGTAWAQTYVGVKAATGVGIPKDVEASVRWFSLAAEQGDVHSMSMLAIKCLNGTDGVPKSIDRAWELAWPAAQQGCAMAQTTCGDISAERGNLDESLQWYTLSAARGFPPAQCELGKLFYEGDGSVVAVSPFKAHHWFKKAALHHILLAPWYMSNLVLEIAKIVHGSDETLGYCPWPESCVWSNEFYDTLERAGQPVTQAERDRGNIHARCAHCHILKSPTVKMTQCAECQTFSYCSSKCQQIHWKKGHKADCNRAKELKQSLARI